MMKKEEKASGWRDGGKQKGKWVLGDGFYKKPKKVESSVKSQVKEGCRQRQKKMARERRVRGGSVCLLLCSTWIHPFLSAFHSHSLARSLCHCHARALSFFSPSFLFGSFAFFTLALFVSVPPLEPFTPLPPLTFVQLLLLWAFSPPLLCLWFIYLFLLTLSVIFLKISWILYRQVGQNSLRKKSYLDFSDQYLD